MTTPAIPLRDVYAAGLSSAVLGACSTVGDWIWARYIPDGAVVPGIVHGVLFFVLLALVLGGSAGSGRATRRLLVTLPLAGLVLAAAFYPLAYAIGYLGALLATWVGMWLALAFLQRWAGWSGEPAGRALLRGLLAAASSGAAFWMVSGMWTAPAAETGYALRLVFWTFAFLPGMAALLVARGSGETA